MSAIWSEIPPRTSISSPCCDVRPRWCAMASSRGTALSIARSRPSTSSTRAVRLRPSCHVGSIDPPGTARAPGRKTPFYPGRGRAAPRILPLRRRAMGTGAKIAMGCGCAALLATAAAVGVVGMGAWWAKGKIHETKAGIDKMTGESEEIERYQKQADANSYTAPTDGVVGEARLLKFVDVRKQVYAVYERYESQLKELSKKSESAGNKLTLSEVWSAGGTLASMASEIRLAQMKGLASVGMSEAEYRDIQMAVTKAAWAFQSESQSGKLPAEQVSETMSEAAKQM